MDINSKTNLIVTLLINTSLDAKPVNGDIVVATIDDEEFSSKFPIIGICYDSGIIFYNEIYNLELLPISNVINIIGHTDDIQDIESYSAEEKSEICFSAVEAYFDSLTNKVNGYSVLVKEATEEELDKQFEADDEAEIIVFSQFEGFLELTVVDSPGDLIYPVLQVDINH